MASAQDLAAKGLGALAEGNLDAARAHFAAALRVDPLYLPAASALAKVLGDTNNLHAAAALYGKLTTYQAFDPLHWSNLGNILVRLERFADAAPALNKAVELDPGCINGWYNLMLMHHRLGEQDKAREALAQIVALGHETSSVHNDQSHITLAEHKSLYQGLVEYEARWHTLPHLSPWDYRTPEWKGEDLEGKSILFHIEQGIGDTIMTSRFARDLAKRGARVGLCVPNQLVRLFQIQNWPGVEVLALENFDEATAARFDFQSPMYSAMRWLGVEWDNIDSAPYLMAPRRSSKPIDGRLFNVGICWASGKRGTDMDWRRRYTTLDLWLPLATVAGVQLHSLQVGDGDEQIEEYGAEGLIDDRSGTFTDWAETATFVAKLDLVISVDTAIIHLAGAMGKPTWMVTQFTPCWRWAHAKQGTGRPWYETMRIFRQLEPGDWKFQLDRCRVQLEELVNQRRQAA